MDYFSKVENVIEASLKLIKMGTPKHSRVQKKATIILIVAFLDYSRG